MNARADTKGKLRALDEPEPGRLNIQYAPSGGIETIENPPRFSWLPAIEDDAEYCLEVSSDDGTQCFEFTGIQLNFFTPDICLPEGSYTWAFALMRDGRRVTEWSTKRSFKVSRDLPETPLPSRSERYASATTAHPRLWLDSDALSAFSAKVADDSSHCNWSTFLEKSVLPWMDRPVMDEPAPYPNDTRVAKIWRQTYIDCQELLYAIRHLAVAGKVQSDDAMLARAKEWLLAAAEWDPDGTTSRAYTDEWAFRVNLALAWGYDWLHDQLTEDERAVVRAALLARTRQVADHAIRNANIFLFPFDSHAVRSLSAVLIPACIAMLGEEPEAEDWLNESVEFLYTVYSPWGDADGGWAEGPHYWMTGMAYLIDAANLLKSFAGLDIYQRPFFQKTGDFPLYTKAPDTRRATFGDDSTMGDLPALKVGYNLRQFAGVTGNAAYQWYFDEICRNDPGTEGAFYNYGWWDLNFDDMVYRHDFPSVEGEAPAPEDRLRWFKGIGWVAIQSRMDDPDRHVQFVMKSSPFGSISHSHGDQNAFCLAAYGEDLAIQSGHYVAFNSTMHQKWRRQTISKNAILIDGKGQYADKDKAMAIRSSGQILDAVDHGGHVFVRGDATAAYQTQTPSVTRVHRDIYFVKDSYFVIVDEVDADEPVSLDWLLHANDRFDLSGRTFRYAGERAGFYGSFLWSEAGPPQLDQTTGFPDVDPAEYEGLPVSTRLKASFPAARTHRIATLLVPYLLSEPRRIFHFLDDQGYDCDLYFTDAQDETFKIIIKKSFAK